MNNYQLWITVGAALIVAIIQAANQWGLLLYKKKKNAAKTVPVAAIEPPRIRSNRFPFFFVSFQIIGIICAGFLLWGVLQKTSPATPRDVFSLLILSALPLVNFVGIFVSICVWWIRNATTNA